MRKTKIICTLGPSTDKDGVLEELVKEGMNVARFNFSHGLHDEQKGRIDKLKEIRTRLNKPVAALLDTKGPEIRIREFENGKVTLKEGQEFTLTTEEIVGNEKIVSVTYKDLYKDVKPGNSILIDDGLIGLEVKKIKGQDIICKVVNGGVLGKPGYDLCRNNCLPDIFTDAHPGFPGSLPDGVILQLGQLRTDYLFLLFRPFLCRTTARLILYPFHVFLLFDGILEIATNGSGFLCGEQSKVVSVYRNITLLSL